MDTLLLTDPIFLEHDPGPGHPENAARLSAVHADLAARPVPGVQARAPRPAAREQLLRVHSPEHLARIAGTAGRLHVPLDADTAACARSHDAALHAAGAVVDAVEAVVAGEARGAFALLRPPGHHAESDRAMGFCLFNNVAVAAAHAVAALGCERVLVLDPDVHHGNGTQRSFWNRSDVLYVSSHQWPFYPGTGGVDEIGEGAGVGFTVNLPLPAGQGDAEHLHVYREVVSPIVRAFAPDLILVSAGFDTWHADPLGGMRVTEAGFRALFHLYADWAATHCPGRLVFALEGGYDPLGVAAGVRAALEVMTDDATAREVPPGDAGPAARAVAARARTILAPHWPGLRTA